MQLATLLALKAFLLSLDGGQNESTVTALVSELDNEIETKQAEQTKAARQRWSRSAITDVEVLVNPESKL